MSRPSDPGVVSTAASSPDTVLNMTPMIDIVFNLVIFFMLTLDLSRREFAEVELPLATQGVEIPDDEDAAPTFVVNLLPGGDVEFKGVRFELSSPDPRARDAVLERLREELARMASDPRWRDREGRSTVRVLIHGDRGAKWQYAQWIMQACGNRRVGIHQVQFAVRHDPERR